MNKSRIILVLIVPLFFSGCGGVFKQKLVTTKIAPISIEYKLDKPLVGKAYVLLAETSTGEEQYRQTVSNSLTNAFNEYGKDFKVFSFSDFTNTLNKEGISKEYSKTRRFYQENGMFEKPDLKLLGEKTGADYFLQPNLINFIQKTDARFTFLGLRLIKTAISDIKIVAEIWDARTGYKVFETTAEETIAGEGMRQKPISLEKTLEIAWKAIIKELQKEIKKNKKK